jgi:hypothetical protein
VTAPRRERDELVREWYDEEASTATELTARIPGDVVCGTRLFPHSDLPEPWSEGEALPRSKAPTSVYLDEALGAAYAIDGAPAAVACLVDVPREPVSASRGHFGLSSRRDSSPRHHLRLTRTRQLMLTAPREGLLPSTVRTTRCLAPPTGR